MVSNECGISYTCEPSHCAVFTAKENYQRKMCECQDPCPVGKEDKHLASAITEQLIMVKIVTTQQEPVQQNVTESNLVGTRPMKNHLPTDIAWL